MSIFRSQAVLVLLVAVAVGACATSPAATASGGAAAPTPTTPPPPPADDNTILITVNYNMQDQGPMTLYIEPTGGIRTVLGTIGANEQKTYTFRVTGSRNVRLAAQSDAGNTGLNSREALTVPAGQGLTWDMALNRLRLVRR